MAPRDYSKSSNYSSFNKDDGSEETPLTNNHLSFMDESVVDKNNNNYGYDNKRQILRWVGMGLLLLLLGAFVQHEYEHFHHHNQKSGTIYNISNPNADHPAATTTTNNNDTDKMNNKPNGKASGPYKLLQAQEGESFFDFYNFYDGEDSLGSAGFNRYVGQKRAFDTGIANATQEVTFGHKGKESTPFVYMSSIPTEKGPRESVRLEGKSLFNRGLFILDLRHMPAGCGVWPAFWMTNEEHWPDYGEIDIVEGINNQTKVKTAMHTSAMCSMYAHVADYNRTGVWDRATGIPDTFTGKMDFETDVPADNCWNMAAHQWENQGCVTVSQEDGTIGVPLNQAGGGIYVLEWDPEHLYIRSWVFTNNKTMPANLEDAIETASLEDEEKRVQPDPQEWGLPYAYFAIGPTTGCSADHFKDMRIVFNLAFCGTVAGNRFGRDCPAETKMFQTEENNPVASCNAYIESEPDALSEAYWKIRGVYVYEREIV